MPCCTETANRCESMRAGGRYGQLHGFVGRRRGYIEAARRFCVQQGGQMEGTIRRPARMQRLRGSRLRRKRSISKIDGKNIAELSALSIENRPLDGRHRKTPFEKTEQIAQKF